MIKEQLLREILAFCERKRRNRFTKEEFLVYLWHKHRGIKFETILRQLRRLEHEGFLVRKKIPNQELGMGYTVVYYAVRSRIRAYLDARSGARSLKKYIGSG